jgi:hypothetical protein
VFNPLRQHLGISPHAVVGFTALTVTAASAALDRRCADREAALLKNLLIPGIPRRLIS